MPNGSSEYSDIAVQKLSMAVSSLTSVVEGLRTELTRSTVVAEQLMVRCGQLEAATKDLQKFLFTGNGQPALTQQIATIRFDVNRITEEIFQAKISQIENSIEGLEEAHKELQHQRDLSEQAHSASKLQVILCVAGGIMGIASAIISAVASYLAK